MPRATFTARHPVAVAPYSNSRSGGELIAMTQTTMTSSFWAPGRVAGCVPYCIPGLYARCPPTEHTGEKHLVAVRTVPSHCPYSRVVQVVKVTAMPSITALMLLNNNL